MQDEYIEELIVRQLQGRLTDEETSRLRQWYDSSEDNRRAYRDYCVLLRAQQTEHDRQLFTADTGKAWQRTRQRLHRRARLVALRPWLRYAAVAIIAIAVGFTASWLTGTLGSAQHDTTVEVPAGAKTRITLPDGTTVWLNSSSRLTYNSTYGKGSRSVTLDGEAYFDVVKNKRSPFLVKAGETQVRVLGTRFDMKAYSHDERSRVTLLEGSLSVSTGRGDSPATVIKPGEQAILSSKSQSIRVRRVKAVDYALWTTPSTEKPQSVSATPNEQLPQMTEPVQSLRKTLLFDEESLTQIAADLERAFNIDIEIRGRIGQNVYYGDFRNDETLFQILDAITSEGDIQYEVADKKIIISRRNGR